MGVSTKRSGTFVRLPEFRDADFTDPKLMAQKLNELKRQLEGINLMLGTLPDVNFGTLADNDLLQYDATSKRWENQSIIATGSYEGTLTGMTTSPTVDVYYIKIDALVVLLIEDFTTGTSNSTAFTITGAPASIRPSANVGIMNTLVFNNGANSQGFVSMNTSGTLVFGNGTSTTGFTSSGTKGVIRINYPYYLR